MSDPWGRLAGWAVERGVPLDVEAVDRLRAFANLLLAANARLNLTRITDPDEVVTKHVLDGLLGLAHLDPLGDALHVVDVGAGGGVPGFPLALARPAWRLTLVEATGRKAEFLREAAAALGVAERVTVRAERAEATGRDPALRDGCDGAVARAVGAAATVLELTAPLVRIGGRVVLYRGPADLDRDARAARAAAARLGCGDVTAARVALPDGVERGFLVAEKRAATDPRYPRRDGVPAKRPLE